MNDTRTRHEPIIQVQRVTAAYQGSVVIDDISFEVYRGEVFVILGGSMENIGTYTTMPEWEHLIV